MILGIHVHRPGTQHIWIELNTHHILRLRIQRDTSTPGNIVSPLRTAEGYSRKGREVTKLWHSAMRSGINAYVAHPPSFPAMRSRAMVPHVLQYR